MDKNNCFPSSFSCQSGCLGNFLWNERVRKVHKTDYYKLEIHEGPRYCMLAQKVLHMPQQTRSLP